MIRLGSARFRDFYTGARSSVLKPGLHVLTVFSRLWMLITRFRRHRWLLGVAQRLYGLRLFRSTAWLVLPSSAVVVRGLSLAIHNLGVLPFASLIAQVKDVQFGLVLMHRINYLHPLTAWNTLVCILVTARSGLLYTPYTGLLFFLLGAFFCYE